jgi:hypothetical protein
MKQSKMPADLNSRAKATVLTRRSNLDTNPGADRVSVWSRLEQPEQPDESQEPANDGHDAAHESPKRNPLPHARAILAKLLSPVRPDEQGPARENEAHDNSHYVLLHGRSLRARERPTPVVIQFELAGR